LDNAIFFLIPMMFMVWDFTYVWQQTVAALIFEVVYEILFFALTSYMVRKINAMDEGTTIIVDGKTREVADVIN